MVHRGIIACSDLSAAECAMYLFPHPARSQKPQSASSCSCSSSQSSSPASGRTSASVSTSLSPSSWPSPFYVPPHQLVLAIDAFRTELRLFSHLADYSYSVYFSVLVLKLGLKLLRVIRHKINFPTQTKIIYTIFIIYQIFLLAALAYSIATKDQ